MGNKEFNQPAQHILSNRQRLFLLLVILIGLYTAGCKGDIPPSAGVVYTESSVETPGQEPIDHPSIEGKHYGAPGQATDMSLKNNNVPGATLTWNPPPGSSNFQFPGSQPEPGGPPFVFNDVGANTDINVGYNLPDLPPGNTTYNCSNSLTASDGQGNSSTSGYSTVIGNFINRSEEQNDPQTAAPAYSNPVPEAESKINPEPEQPSDTMLWYVDEVINSEEITMTTQLCQDIFSAWQQENFFQAIRIPMPVPTVTQSYSLPLVFQKDYYPTLTLNDDPWSYSPVLSGTAEYRYEYLTYLENELPAAKDEHWLAIGLSATDPITCVEGMAYPPNGWSFFTEIWLDLADPTLLSDPVVLTSYICYEGSNTSMLRSGLFNWGFPGEVTRTPANGNYQEVTCIGPEYRFLDSAQKLVLRGSETRFITTTATLTYPHTLVNSGGTTMSVTLETSSTLEVDWKLYAQPDGTDEITGPFTMDNGAKRNLNFWIIGEVPGGIAAGSYTVKVTATTDTNPVISVWASDTVWVGELEIPPAPEPPEKYVLYLPIVQ